MIYIVKSKEEFVNLLQEHENVLVDFYADWCGPCRMLGHVFHEIENVVKDVAIVKVNVDNLQELAVDHRVFSIPAMFFYKNGNRIDAVENGQRQPNLVGARDALSLVNIINTTFNL